MVVWGVGRDPIGFVAPLRFKPLDSQPEKSNMGPVSTNVHDFELFRKVVEASWPSICRVFGPVDLKTYFGGFRSVPKSCATKSYADSWRYHLDKCLIRPFHVHLFFNCFRAFSETPSLRLSQSRESSVH